ncbi:5-(carboxyamino)imidazole ribonucleotide synthase [Aquamicrobium segne]|uniref:N5-carboxyaminoimidazole ribonucleotide synthase n=1 Tax=Aquamicrobium segne TaxID=469547 RepID=A0ABW0H0I5_9HYPH
MMLAPGSTIGIIGGGQLGRMLAMAAARLGYHIAILEPQAECPAAQLANRHIVAAYDDPAGLAELAAISAVITYEFENVPVEAVEALAAKVPVLPPPRALEMSQDRLVEKQFLNSIGIGTAPFLAVDSDADLASALQDFGGNGVLKTRRMGYDGKGQRVFRNTKSTDCAGVFEDMGGVPLILEGLISFEREISVIGARDANGHVAIYDAAENVHRDGILHTSTVPAAISPAMAGSAGEATATLLDALGYVGVIGVEFFALEDGSLLVNEMAPRVHNSGHWTEVACTISQFEQHIRAIAGLTLGSPRRHSDCVMENLIGDDVARLPELVAETDIMVHLYGKTQARAGRKMGHFTRIFVAPDVST